jgi:hypothetical protein
VILDCWDDYPWKHRLSEPTTSITAIEQMLQDFIFDVTIYDAKLAEEEEE